MIYAYLADGYFDRQAPTTNFSVSYDTEDVAYWGQLVYNPINKASIFIPYSGFIEGESGELSSRGQYINVWTSSSASESTAIIWKFNYDDGGALVNKERAEGFSGRCVVNK